MQKIMFSDKYGLTDAVLEGRKTMTRRPLGEVPPITVNGVLKQVETMYMEHGKLVLCCGDTILYAPSCLQPRFKVGEIVAIAQSYDTILNRMIKRNNVAAYRQMRTIAAFHHCKHYCNVRGAVNKMFVMAKFMPDKIRFTDVRLERLQDISNEDAMREGVYMHTQPPLYHELDMYSPWPPSVKPYKHPQDNNKYFCEARYAFKHLINKICGGRTWNYNPWVYVYEFELVK